MQNIIAHFEGKSTLPVVKLSQKDVTFNLLIDTGCNISCIDENVLNKLLYKKTKDKTTSILYASGEETGTLDIYKIPFVIGDIIFEDYFNTIDMTPLTEKLKSQFNIEIDGLMGSNFLAAYGLILDFRKRVLIYTE